MDSNVKAALSYVLSYVTGAVFLIFEKEDDFVRKNAAQSIVLGLAMTVLNGFFGATPLIGGVLRHVFVFFFVVITILLAFKAFKNTYLRIPLIADISEKYVVNWFKK